MQADLLALVHSELLVHRSVKGELHHAALIDWCLICKASRHPVEQMSRGSLQRVQSCSGVHWSVQGVQCTGLAKHAQAHELKV